MYSVLNPNRSFVIEIEGEIFEGKFPLPSQEIDIDLSVSRRMGGVSLESFPAATYGYLLATKTLDHVITRKPDSFLKRYKNFEECEDMNYVIEIYSQYAEKKAKFLEMGKKNRSTRSNVTESRADSRPVSNEDLQYPNPERDNQPPGTISVPEGVHPRSDLDSGRLYGIPRKNADFQENPRDREYQPEVMDSRSHSNYPGGDGRVHRRDDYPRG